MMCYHSAIPEGTSVFVHFYSLHRDVLFLAHAGHFLARALVLGRGPRIISFIIIADDRTVYFVLDKSAFSFSFSPSICVGKSLTY